MSDELADETIRQIILDVFEIASQKKVVCSLLRHRNPEVHIKRAAEHLTIQLGVFFAGYKLPTATVTLEVRHPKTWWQAFKKQYFPPWALKKWPVRETITSQEHTFDTTVLLTDIIVPQDQSKIISTIIPGVIKTE